MEQFEQSGKTTDEAVRAAEERVGRKLRKAEYRVLEPGTRGVLGLIGAKPAVIEVTPRDSGRGGSDGESADLELLSEWAVQEAEAVLERMGLPGRADLEIVEGYYKVNVEMDESDSGIVIGRRGTTLEALQHVLRRVVEKKAGRAVPIVVDVGGYRERKRTALIQRAERLAQQVRRTGKQFTLDAMPPGERRAVHLALKQDKDITTYSVGDEPDRKIVIAPAKGSRPAKRRRRDDGRDDERVDYRDERQGTPQEDEPELGLQNDSGDSFMVAAAPLDEEPSREEDEEQSSTPAAYGRRRLYRRPRNRPTRPPSSE